MSHESLSIRVPIQLSPRQQQILRLLAEGETTKGIALTLGLSAKTVEWHRKILMQRTRLFNYQDLTKLAIRLGLVQIEV